MPRGTLAFPIFRNKGLAGHYIYEDVCAFVTTRLSYSNSLKSTYAKRPASSMLVDIEAVSNKSFDYIIVGKDVPLFQLAL